jgi:hypothetical protein
MIINHQQAFLRKLENARLQAAPIWANEFQSMGVSVQYMNIPQMKSNCQVWATFNLPKFDACPGLILALSFHLPS